MERLNTVSICMGTYNGENYIEEQLDSIYRQTRRADQVVLCDDGSTDKTRDIIRKFIKEHQLDSSWVLYCNQKKLGYPANFYYACSLCTGEIVFFADQDDIWSPEKLEKMCEVFKSYKEAAAVCCKFGLIDQNGKKLHSLMESVHSQESGNVRKVTIKDVFYKAEWPGMVMACRREWYEQWSDGQYSIPHDLLVAAKAAEEGRFFQLDRNLASHRRHECNTGKEEHRIGKLLNKQRKLKEIEDYLKILKEFSKKRILATEEGRQVLAKKQESMEGRLESLNSGRIGKVITNAVKNRKETRLATMICDLLIVKKHTRSY